MKLALFLLLPIAAVAQNPNPCSQIRNQAKSGQVLSATANGATPPCQWIAGGGGGGGGTVTNIATSSPIAGGPITTTGTISCPTCVVGPASVTSGHIATFNGTTGKLIQDGGAPATGTVTSIATTSPITGGTITGTGTIGCATCVVTSRTISTTSPLTGGGDLSADRTLACATCATSTPTNHGVAIGSATQALSFSTAGSSGQCFISGGASADPAFTTCPGGGLTVGTTTITSGATTKVLFDNAGVLGEYTISGTGNVCMTTSCSMTTPALGTPSAGVLTNATGLPWGSLVSTTNSSYSVPAGATNVPTTGWTLQNASNAHGTFLDLLSNEVVMMAGNFGTAQWSALTRTVSVPYTIYAQIQLRGLAPGNVSSSVADFCISDGTKYEGFGIQITAGANIGLEVRTLSTLSTGGSVITGPTTNIAGTSYAVKVVNNSTTREFFYAAGGGTWTSFKSEASGTFLTETAAGICSLTDISSGGYNTETAIKAWSQ